MGAGGGGGGKNNPNVELNLVPFIDLFSTLICFLLMTAVWQTISMLSTNSASTTTSDSPPPPDNKPKIDLKATIYQDRTELNEGEKVQIFPNVGTDPDVTNVDRVLKEWKVKYPERKDLQLFSVNEAVYKQLIKIMDVASGAGFEDVGVNTN